MEITAGFPEELSHEILIRLPVKSVLKCKSVCKSWLSLISNPNFAKSHLQNIKNNSSSRLLLGLGESIHSISYDSLESSLSSKEIEDSAVRMHFPFELHIQDVRLFGSCNGLVFLWYDSASHENEAVSSADSDADSEYDFGDDYFDADSEYDSENDFVDDYSDSDSFTDDNDDYNFEDGGGCNDFLCVWNPATWEYKKIQSPNAFFDVFHKGICMNGLAYDGKNDDYRFVIGMHISGRRLLTLVEVFSLRTNSWKAIQAPYEFPYDEQKSGVLVNGDLHWLAIGKSGVCIVYLDISDENPSFKEIQLLKIPFLRFVSVAVLEEGSLCVVADNGDPPGWDCIEVWEMQVYGVRESWTKRYLIGNETISKALLDRVLYWKIMWSYKNGKLVFVDSHNIVIYDPKDESAIERTLDRFANFTSEVNYLESLVSLNSGTYMGTERIKESTEDEA